MPTEERDPEPGRLVLSVLTSLARQAAARLGRPAVLMEVCGTHTMAIARSGLKSLLDGCLELRSGPGCPVCVTGQGDIDQIIALARRPSTVIATFGDMLPVPGTASSLAREKARGAQVEIFYAPLEAVCFAARHPDKEVVFLGVGFETTAPCVALSLAAAASQGLANFSVLSLHKLVPPVLQALLRDPAFSIDGLLLPGHVCAITGRRAFDFTAAQHGVPSVVAGFEPVAIMTAACLLLKQIIAGQARTVNGYPLLVRELGNRAAQAVMRQYFTRADVSWRGFGLIPQSGLALRAKYAFWDAAARFPVAVPERPPPDGCACGAVLQGKITPPACPLFARACTPLQPVGPCMVSSEGTCAAYYHYVL